MAFSSVVLPEPVPPEISTFRRALAAICRKRDSGSDRVPRRTMSSSPIERCGNLRIDRCGAVEGQRRQQDVDAAAVGEAGHRRSGSIRRRAGRPRRRCLGDVDHVLVVAEARRHLSSLPWRSTQTL